MTIHTVDTIPRRVAQVVLPIEDTRSAGNVALVRPRPRPAHFWAERWLGLCGVIGPVLFVAAFTIAGLLRPGYSAADQAVSDLGVGDNAWVVNGALVLFGLSLVAFAVGFYRDVRTRETRTLPLVSAVLLAAVGVGFAAAGIFPETTPIHWVVGASLVYGGAPLGFALAGIHFLRTPRLKRWATPFFLAAAVSILLVGATFYVFSSYTYTGGPAPVGQGGGTMERAVFIWILAWYVLFGWRIYRGRA